MSTPHESQWQPRSDASGHIRVTGVILENLQWSPCFAMALLVVARLFSFVVSQALKMVSSAYTPGLSDYSTIDAALSTCVRVNEGEAI